MGLNEKRVSVTPGMARVLRKHEIAYSCAGCDMLIPRYPGRYPSTCPACGGALSKPELDDTSRASESVFSAVNDVRNPNHEHRYDHLAVVAVSVVPRLQALIEAGHRWREAPVGHVAHEESVPITCTFALIEKMIPGGVQGLEWFLEGPIGEHYYRVERTHDPVLVFSVNEGTKSVVIVATQTPAKALGFDPRAEIVDEALDEVDILDSLMAPTRKGVFAPRPEPGQGAHRIHGGFRFEIGKNKKRRPMKDVARSIQNRRNSRRGLANRVRAAKVFHRSMDGAGLHKDLGRYNTGNHRGESIGRSLWAALKEEVATLPLSLGIPREQMPQIEGNQIEAFIHFLGEHGVHIELLELPVKELRGTQKDVDLDKAAGMMGELVDAPHDHPLRAPVFSSSDGYILDGHHRWAAMFMLDDSMTVPTWRTGIPILELVQLARKFGGATYKKVGEAVNEDVPGSVPAAGGDTGNRPTAADLPPTTGLQPKSVDDVFDGLLRKLIVIESTDVLEDVEFTEDGSIYLFLDPTLSRAEIEEIVRALATGESKLALVASPDCSLPGETGESDWWVAYLPSEAAVAATAQPDPNVYARVPGTPGQTQKQQIVVTATTTLDAIAASVDVNAALAAAGKTEKAQ